MTYYENYFQGPTTSSVIISGHDNRMPSSIGLEELQTEGRNSGSGNIDQVSTLELCQIINNEDATVAAAVQKCLPMIAQTIDALAGKVRRGGRVVYVGAGTSGRYANS